MKLFLTFLSLFLLNIGVAAQKMEWGKNIGGNQNDVIWNVESDQFGNYFILGEFSGTLTLDSLGSPRNLSSAGGRDIFLAKMDCNNTLQWRVRIGGISDDGGEFPFMGLKIAQSGNIYLSGSYSGQISVYNANQAVAFSNINSAGGTDAFIAKISNSGNFNWLVSCGGSLNDENTGLEIDANENVFTTGFFTGIANFQSVSGNPGISKASLGSSDIYVTKHNLNGIVQSVTTAGGVLQDVGNNLSIDDNGDLYVTGGFSCCSGATAQFDSHTISNASGWGAFLAKLSNNGTWLWANCIGGSGSDAFSQVAIDKVSKSVYVSGHFNQSAGLTSQLPGSTYNAVCQGDYDIIVAKYNYQGVIQWAKTFGGSGSDFCYAMDLDKKGNIIIGGAYSNNIHFGNFTLDKSGTDAGYVVSLDPLIGITNWVSQVAGTSGSVNIFDIHVSQNNVLFGTGYFTTNIKINNQLLNTFGAGDGFVIKYFLKDSSSLTANRYQLSCGDSVRLNANRSGASYFRWFRNDTFLQQTSNSDFYTKISGNYKVVSFNHCLGFDTTNLVLIYPSLEGGTYKDIIICLGDSITIGYNNPQYTNLLWSPIYNINDINSNTPKVWPRVDTRYILSAINDKCSVHDTFQVKVQTYPTVDAGDSINICKHEIGVLAGKVSNAMAFSWDKELSLSEPKILNPQVWPNESKTYYLVANNHQCISVDSVVVHVYPEVVASFTASQTNGLKPLPIVFNNLSSENASNFLWQFGDGASSNEKNPLYTFNKLGNYEVSLIAQDIHGCRDTASMRIEVTEEEFLFVPNAFTPNANELNDVFKPVYSTYHYPSLTLSVYNRWGELIHETNMPGGQWWDGKYKDQPCTEGVYFYKLTTTSISGKSQILTGTITLLK